MKKEKGLEKSKKKMHSKKNSSSPISREQGRATLLPFWYKRCPVLISFDNKNYIGYLDDTYDYIESVVLDVANVVEHGFNQKRDFRSIYKRDSPRMRIQVYRNSGGYDEQ